MYRKVLTVILDFLQWMKKKFKEKWKEREEEQRRWDVDLTANVL